MKRVKKTAFYIAIAAMTLVLIFALASCNFTPNNNNNQNNDNPGDNQGDQQQGGALTEEEIQELIATASLDLSGNVQIDTSMSSGGYVYSSTAGIVNGNYFRIEDTTKEYIVKSGDDNYLICDDTDPSNLVSVSYHLQPWETQLYAASFVREYSEMDLKSMIDYYVAGAADTKEELGTDYVESVTASKDDNGYNVQMEISVAERNHFGAATPVLYSASITLDNNKRIKSIYLNASLLNGWYADNTVLSDHSYTMSYNVKYGTDVTQVIPNPSGYTSGDLNPASDTVHIYANATMPGSFETELTPGSTVNLPAPTENADNFLGWYYDYEMTMPISDSQIKVVVDTDYMEVYPKWKNFVELELNGGKLEDDDLADVNYAHSLYAYNSIKPVKAGYTFIGWYKDANFTDAVTDADSDWVTATTKLYAKYQKNVTLTVVNNSNFKTMALNGKTGQVFTLPDPVKKGYIFDGWYTDAELTTPTTYSYPETDGTLYAKYHEGIAVNIDAVMPEGNTVPDHVPQYLNFETGVSVATVEAYLHSYTQYVGEISRQDSTIEYLLYWAADKNGTKITSITNNMTVYAYRLPALYAHVRVYKDGNLYINNDQAIMLQDLYRNNNNLYTAVNLYMGQLYSSDSSIAYYNYEVHTDSNRTQTLTADFAYGNTTVDIYIDLVKKPHYSFVLGDGGTMWKDLGGGSAQLVNTTDDEYKLYLNDDAFELYYCDLTGTPASIFDTYGFVPEDSVDYKQGYFFIKGGDGNYFEGWYTDPGFNDKYVPGDTMPTSTVTLYAKYVPIPKTLVLANGTGYNVTTNAVPEDYLNYDSTNDYWYVDYLAFARRDNQTQTLADYLANNCTGIAFTGNDLDHESASVMVQGFYSDAGCTSAYAATDFPTTDTTIYLKWQNMT